jgi:hypothetical protein
MDEDNNGSGLSDFGKFMLIIGIIGFVGFCLVAIGAAGN